MYFLNYCNKQFLFRRGTRQRRVQSSSVEFRRRVQRVPVSYWNIIFKILHFSCNLRSGARKNVKHIIFCSIFIKQIRIKKKEEEFPFILFMKNKP